jgi:hypothetical protein
MRLFRRGEAEVRPRRMDATSSTSQQMECAGWLMREPGQANLADKQDIQRARAMHSLDTGHFYIRRCRGPGDEGDGLVFVSLQ